MSDNPVRIEICRFSVQSAQSLNYLSMVTFVCTVFVIVQKNPSTSTAGLNSTLLLYFCNVLMGYFITNVTSDFLRTGQSEKATIVGILSLIQLIGTIFGCFFFLRILFSAI